MPALARARLGYVAAALATILVGLAVHRAPVPLPPAVRDVAGDALWAVMATWWVSAAWPSAPRLGRGAAALAVCFAVEIGQLLRTPVLDAVRATTLGRLALGTHFDPRDLAAYAAGVVAAVLLDAAASRASRRG